MVEQVQERYEIHVICSVVAIGLVKPVWLWAEHLSCKQKISGSIAGGGMKGLSTSVILARQLGLGQKGRLLLL